MGWLLQAVSEPEVALRVFFSHLREEKWFWPFDGVLQVLADDVLSLVLPVW